MSEVASQILDQAVAPAAPAAPTEQAPVATQGTPQASTEAPKEPIRQEALSPRLEVLIRREQAAISREKQAKAKEADLQAQMTELEELKTLREARKNGDHKKVFELLRFNKDELAKTMFQEDGNPLEVELKQLREELHTYKNSQSEVEKQRLEEAKKQTAQAEAAATSNFKSEINRYLKDNSSRYELIDFEEQQDLVFEVIDEHYQRTLDPETGIGKVMSTAEAADKVEEWLEKKYEKAKEVSKVKTLWGAVPPKVMQEAVKPKTPISQKPQTLTNQLSASPQMPRKAPMTDQERVQRAIAYAKSLRPSL